MPLEAASPATANAARLSCKIDAQCDLGRLSDPSVALLLGIYALATAFIEHSQLGDPNQFQHFMKNIALVGGAR